MSKLIKRIGTKAYKFHVDIYLKKFEMNMINAQQCKCLIIFKRGEHTIKCENPVPLQNKEAKFKEILSHISTLYYKKKKKKYLPKTAQLDIVLIFSDNQQKAAGSVFIDLATYPNTGNKKTLECLPVEKCPDKNAKLTFEIKIAKLGEVQDPENDNSFIQSNAPFKKPNQKAPLISKNPTDLKNSIPPPKDSKPLVKSKILEKSIDNTKDLSKSNSFLSKQISNQNMSKQAKNNKNSSSSEEESSNNSNSSGSEASSSGSESQSGSNSNSKNSEPTLKKPGFVTVKIDQQKANRKSKSNLIEEKPKKKTENKGFKSNELNISNLKSVKTLNSDDQLSQKIKNLLNSNSESKDSTRIENGTIKKVSEDRKIALPRNFNPIKNSDDEDDDHMFSEFSAQKIKQLEVKLSVKTKENQGNLDKIQELTEEINELTDDMNRIKQELSQSQSLPNKNTRVSVGTPTFEAAIVEKESELKALRLENLELKNTLKMKDLELKEKNLSLTKNSETQIQELKLLLESKEKTIKELELENDQSTELIRTLKSSNNSISTTKSKEKISEDFYKKKIESLNEEVYDLKKQLEDINSTSELSRLELEAETTKVKIENQSLVKQLKELQNLNKTTALSLKSSHKSNSINNNYLNNNENSEEFLELKERFSILDEQKKKLEKEKLALEMKIKENEKNFNEKVFALEDEIQKNRLKLAEVLNVAMEAGGAELVELIENAVIDPKKE